MGPPVILAGGIGSLVGCAPKPNIPEDSEGARLALRLFMRTPAGTARAVELAQPVFSGDQLAVELTLAQARSLVVLKGVDLERVVAAAPSPGAAARVPESGWLPLGGPDAVGRLVMVVTHHPVDDAKARELVEAARSRPDVDERIIAIDPAYAARRRPGGTEVTGPRRTFRLRGPWLAEDDAVGAIRSEGYPEDEALIVELRIQTER